ncbi:Phosphatidylglycerophosphatase A [Labilithrix luteola]|jgi:phosphatidylglycerophosphatase A|uniref:Phosphatidylglycerophosphatase A n=1 Tax=Labilithrix luteola TaxID=1391654 RepID=A0A0K1QC19_9BACT|nr:phosphatidylglycerophosphatase A [Labilithrix luteola]AKV03326.1 Phosphatidylglycerophosphatase A [Labilithrix luteola]
MKLSHRIAYAIALWFGCGLSPVGPGTVGSLGALPLYFAVRSKGPLAVLAVTAVVFVVGTWASGVVAETKKTKDPQIVVVDEVVGVLIALAAAPMTTAGVVAGFVLFRLFDMTKPFPARRAEKLPGGLGIVMDDVVAGIQAALVIFVLRYAGVLR